MEVCVLGGAEDPAAEVKPDPNEATMHSYKGRLFVDFALDGEWYLTDTMVLQSKVRLG